MNTKAAATELAQFFYTPYIVDLLFEKSMENICVETNISRIDKLDKCYKMREYLRACQDDISKNKPITQSCNPAAPMLINLLSEYITISKHPTTTKQTTLLEFK